MLNGFLDRLASGVRTKAEAEVAAAPTRKRESPRQDQVRALLNSKPDADYRDIVKALYGEYTKASVLNARSLISNMKREGQIIGEPGAWRVVDSEQAKGPTVEVPPVPMSPFAQAS
jgi:hypothetical protein